MRLICPKSFTTFAAIAASLTLAACGNKEEVIHHAETEGIYVNVGELKYQVQISRALNPESISEDRTFLEGLSPEDAELGPDEVWFAVFMYVENESDEAQAPAEHYEIVSQTEEVFEPVELPETNPFHYDVTPIPPGGVAPSPDSVARQLTSIGGMLQLFKMKHSTLDNRPLELIIKADESSEEESTVDLDV